MPDRAVYFPFIFHIRNEECRMTVAPARSLKPPGRISHDLSKKASSKIIFLEAFYIDIFRNRFCKTRLAGLLLIA
jgi:hypothetical protein